ncbi:MAG: hypothetical protein CMJ64_02460 [Planctomycetaceae bacterium]|nr:hypothetical protein [Planctomycetaceae bacterium]
MHLLIRLLAPAAVLFCFIGQTQADSESSRIPQLIEALDDENFRFGASIALAQMGKDAVPALRKSLVSDKLDLRVWSVYTLGEIGSAAEPAVGDLTESLGNNDSALRAAATQTLGKIGPASAPSVGALADLLSDENTVVRRWSAVALGQIGPRAEQAAPQLIAALKDSRIRPSAKTSLIQIGKPTAGQLRQSLGDEKLRFDVSAILLKLYPDSAKQAGVDQPTLADVASLRLVLHDLTRSPQERTSAATALAALGKEGTVVLIEAFEEQPIAGTAASACASVAPDGVAPLIDALTHEQPGVRAAAADALGHIGPAANEAVPHLVRLFKDSDHNVRYRAVLALDAFGQKAAPAVPDLIEVMLDSSQREAARQWAMMTLVNTLPDTHDTVVKGLIKASQDKGNYGVSSLAKSQVRKIDPKAAEAAGIR